MISAAVTAPLACLALALFSVRVKLRAVRMRAGRGACAACVGSFLACFAVRCGFVDSCQRGSREFEFENGHRSHKLFGNRSFRRNESDNREAKSTKDASHARMRAHKSQIHAQQINKSRRHSSTSQRST